MVAAGPRWALLSLAVGVCRAHMVRQHVYDTPALSLREALGLPLGPRVGWELAPAMCMGGEGHHTIWSWAGLSQGWACMRPASCRPQDKLDGFVPAHFLGWYLKVR